MKRMPDHLVDNPLAIELLERGPTVIAPIEGIVPDAQLVEAHSADVLELRYDFLDDITHPALLEFALRARAAHPGKPTIGTTRLLEQGGNWPTGDLFNLDGRRGIFKTMLDSNDGVDVELVDEELLSWVVGQARNRGKLVIASHHLFRGGFDINDDLLDRMQRANQFGADVFKIAVQIHDEEDFRKLAIFTRDANQAGNNVLAVGMAGDMDLAMRTRLEFAGAEVGSVATFGFVGRATVPGQVHVGVLRETYGRYRHTA